MQSYYSPRATSHANLSLPVHERIGDLHDRAMGLAPRVEDSAADSGCTDTRPSGPRQGKAWDMVAEALGWNAISDRPELLELAERYEREGRGYRVAYVGGDEPIGIEADDQAAEPVAELTDRTGRPVRWGYRHHCTDPAGWYGAHTSGNGKARRASCASCSGPLEDVRGTWAVMATSADPGHVYGLADAERTFTYQRDADRGPLDICASYAPLQYVWLAERDILEDAAAEHLAAEPVAEPEPEPVTMDTATLADAFHAIHDLGQAFLSGRISHAEYRTGAATLNGLVRSLTGQHSTALEA